MLEMNRVSVEVDGASLFAPFDLHLSSGETVLLAGPSGSGKSTILRALLGFIPLSSGEIIFDGILLTSHSLWALRRRIAYVPQVPAMPNQTVSDWLIAPFSYAANRQIPFSLEEVDQVMDRLALPQALKAKNTHDLSGGERQRLAVLQALMLKRSLLLLDEPTAALDHRNRERLWQTLREVGPDTRLIVSHDTFDDVMGADRIVSVGSANHECH